MLFIQQSCKTREIVTPKKYLNFRDKPTTQNSSILRVLKPGEILTIIEKRGRWVKIKTEKEEIGWAHSNYLTETNKNMENEPTTQRTIGILKIKY